MCVGDDVLLLILSGRNSIFFGSFACIMTESASSFALPVCSSLRSHLMCPSEHCPVVRTWLSRLCIYPHQSVSLSTSTPTFCSRSRIEHTHTTERISTVRERCTAAFHKEKIITREENRTYPAGT